MGSSEIDCNQVLRAIELYLDDELDSGRCDAIERHLSACGGCFSHKEFRVTLQRVIADKCGRESLPQGLVQRIELVLSEEHISEA